MLKSKMQSHCMKIRFTVSFKTRLLSQISYIAQDICNRIIPVFGVCLFAGIGFANQPAVLHREYPALHIYIIHFQAEVDRHQFCANHLPSPALRKHSTLRTRNDDYT